MTNTRFQEIESSWNEFFKMPFPEEGKSYTVTGGQDFTRIDTLAAGCISTFIQTKGRLDELRYDCLKTCSSDLSIAINELDAGTLKTNAEQLQFLSKSVLEYLDQKTKT